jgi:hypothetical protein
MRYVIHWNDESQYSQCLDKSVVTYFISVKIYFILFPLHFKRLCLVVKTYN